MAEKITKDMVIMDALQKHPEAAKVLIENGIHCLGCVAASGESLEQGLKAHGKSDKEVDEVIKKMNDSIKKS